MKKKAHNRSRDARAGRVFILPSRDCHIGWRKLKTLLTLGRATVAWRAGKLYPALGRVMATQVAEKLRLALDT